VTDAGKAEKNPKLSPAPARQHEAASSPDQASVGTGGAGYQALMAERQLAMEKVTYRATEGAEGIAPAGHFAAQRRDVVGGVAHRLMRKAADSSSVTSAKIPEAGGSPLTGDLRNKLEPKLGADLSAVRIHTGGESASAASHYGARAFTLGNDVHFNKGEFNPGTKEGNRLLGHELTHVVQGQSSGPVQRKADDGAEGESGEHEVSDPADASEKEADQVGDHVADSLESEGKDEKKDDKKKGQPAKGAADPAAKKDSAPVSEKAPPKISAKLEAGSRKRPTLPPLVAKLGQGRLHRARGGKHPDLPKLSLAPQPGKRVDQPVPGLYNSVNGGAADKKPMQLGDLSFKDTIEKKFPDGSPAQVFTEVKATGKLPGNGHVMRSLKPEKDGSRTFVMDEAFLDGIPKELSWVSDDGKPLDRPRGIPLQTYMTIRQMKIMKIEYGDLGKPNLSKVKISTIVNHRTIWELAALMKGANAVPSSEQLLQTHSATYASTPITQAGAKIVKAGLGDPGLMTLAGEYAKEKNEVAELKARGLKPKDFIRKNFDIVLDVAPFHPTASIPPEIKDKP